MKSIWSASIALLGSVAFAGGALAGNTSSNSSSNTSSNSSSGGSSYVHPRDWSIDSDDNGRRRSVRGSTRIERYPPAPDRHRRPRAVYQYRFDDDD